MTGMGTSAAGSSGTGGELAVVVRLKGEELTGLHALATLAGIVPEDAEGFARAVASAVRVGVAAQLEQAGLPWGPTADDLEAAMSLVPEMGLLQMEPADAGAPEPEPVAGVIGRLTGPGALRAALVGVGLFMAVTMAGGYGAGWKWTGFSANGQVWDWLELLLLPAAFAMVPLWLRFGDDMEARRKSLLTGVVVAFGLFVVAGYAVPLVWTGFPGQTLWNWLTLIALPVSLTTIQTWPTTSRRVHAVHLAAALSFATGLAVTALGGYLLGWRWTGYEGNTLWDWLHLLLAPLVINTVVVPALIRLASGDASRRAAERAQAAARQRLLESACRRAGVGPAPSLPAGPEGTVTVIGTP